MCTTIMCIRSAGQAFAPAGTQTFEVATVRPSPPNQPNGQVRPLGGKRYVGVALPLRSYLYVAYQVRGDQIVGGPDWVDTKQWDLRAEAPKSANIEELHVMLQNVLIEKFKLRFHFESKRMLAYVLSADKSGVKNLKPHPGANAGQVVLDLATQQLVHATFQAHCASLDFLSWRLARILERPVINETGLKGCFDFELKFTRDLPPGFDATDLFNGQPVDTLGPTVFQALQRQLGLKLESKKALVSVMVIDSAQQPEPD